MKSLKDMNHDDIVGIRGVAFKEYFFNEETVRIDIGII
jgi:hypothetical protein